MEPIREAEMQTQPGKRLAEAPNPPKGGKSRKKVVEIIAAVVVVCFCACCMLANSRDTFFPHTTINGVEVGGLTVEEAQSRLEAEIPQRVCKIYLNKQEGVSLEGREPDASITFAELGLFPESGYEAMAKSPFILQQGKGYLSTTLTYVESLLGKDTGYNSSLYWDSQKLDQAISKLSSVLNVEPLDMAYQLNDHSLQITTARDGRSVADNELRRTIQNVVKNSSEAEAVVELPAEVLPAQIINGLVLNSGETFSYNGSVGKRTADRGFKPAPAYVKGETVDEIGGGICQTSSTLYLACLLSNLEITERYAHRYVPAYIAWGMDATVSWGGPDYKFTNNTLYPVKIVTKYEKGYLTVQILGTNVDGTYVKMSNEVLSKTPWETIYQEDPTMAPGSPDVVKVTPYTGYKVNSYQTIYDKDGKVIDSHFEASSNYKVRNKVILQAPAAQPGSGTAEIPAVTPDTPSDTPVPMEPTVPAEPAASPDLPVEPEIPAEP